MGLSETEDEVIHKSVPVCVPDNFINKLEHVSIMKLDCEGCEGQALYASEKILSRFQPAVVLEVTEWVSE